MTSTDSVSLLSSPSSVLAHLSFEASGEMENVRSVIENNSSMQGVLWKRRDVFKSRWRPRWFVLHPEQHILTYYLLTEPEGSFSETTTPTIITNNNNNSTRVNRRRTVSESSNVPENTVDYDVVPRGSINLLGCMVEANEALTQPENQLYALTIFNHQEASYIHLAERTSSARDRWISQLLPLCSPSSPRSTVGGTEDDYQETSFYRPTTAATSSNVSSEASNTTSSSMDETTAEPSKPPEDERVVMKEKKSFPNHWRSVPSPELTVDVPPDLLDKLERLLETHLPYVEYRNHPDLTFKYEKDGIHCSAHKDRPMIRSIRKSESNHPIEYLQLLWDLPRLLEFETNVRMQNRLMKYNKHTFLVHTAYHRVWPTTARDFASCAHWRLLEHANGKDKALCLVAVSCPQANQLQPPIPDHVRGELHVSLNVWQLRPEGGSIHTRMISYDLNGDIPKSIVNNLMERQGKLPRIMDLHLQKTKEGNTVVGMEYEAFYNKLKEVEQDDKEDSDGDDIKAKDTVTCTDSIVTTPGADASLSSSYLRLLQDSLVLLFPIALHRLLAVFSNFNPYVFLITSILAIRWVLLRWMLQYFQSLPNDIKDAFSSFLAVDGCNTSCRFVVDLKEVSRFLSSEQNTKKDLDAESVELVATHVVLRALGQAMAKQPGLIARRYPFLPPLYSIDMCLHEYHRPTKWVSNIHLRSIQDIANCLSLKASATPTTPQTLFGPSCRVWVVPVTDQFQMDFNSTLSDCPINVVLSSSLQGETDEVMTHLTVSITIQSSDMEACLSFVEQAKQLIQSPEME